MCGRFALYSATDQLAEYFRVPGKPGQVLPRYNIAPSQPIINIQERFSRAARALESYTWGFVPSWAKEKGRAPINARAETVATSGLWRTDFRNHRSLIPADGFFEWDRKQQPSQPYFIRLKEDVPMAFAGIFSQPHGDLEMTCAIITCAANDAVGRVHDRMPVILPEDAFEAWLDPDNKDAAALTALLQPCPPELIELYPVSRAVNRPANDGPELIERTQ